MSECLFPRRLTRRNYLLSTAGATAALALSPARSVSGQTAPVARIGSGYHTYDLELNHKRNLTGMVRNPCCFYQHKGFLYIPDLASRVTILDAEDNLAAQLGDGREADGKTNRPDNQTNPALFAAPHALTVDSKGNFYVVEWIPTGRPRKFKHIPA